MAVGLSTPTDLLPIEGLSVSTVAAGIRYSGREDLLLMTLTEGSTTAAVFTKNKYCAAPVILAKEHLNVSNCRAWLINSGNANAGTGKVGMENAKASCLRVANGLGVSSESVLPFSTGVIGEQLPMGVMNAGIDALLNDTSSAQWLDAAKAIMTTDTLPKGVSEQILLDGETITITGIAKGSGMICPNMATMLAYVATDASISNSVLQEMLEKGANASFNRITVDSDTSTNDALVLGATGRARTSSITDIGSREGREFYLALERVLIKLATSVIRDGEGATKFVKVLVDGGVSELDCEAIAYSVAHSPLVKTALFASDPNWGRILMAVGKAPVANLVLDKVAISINEVALIQNGEPASDYTEEAGKAVFETEEITITINLNQGSASYHVWTSDLSHDYVSINADYRS